MTTFTSEDRINAIRAEDKEDTQTMLREQNHTLNQEIMALKTRLAQAERRADSWEEAYHNAMDTMSKMSRARQ
jgi:uncharacterized protein YlxW (UPF0749 family)